MKRLALCALILLPMAPARIAYCDDHDEGDDGRKHRDDDQPEKRKPLEPPPDLDRDFLSADPAKLTPAQAAAAAAVAGVNATLQGRGAKLAESVERAIAQSALTQAAQGRDLPSVEAAESAASRAAEDLREGRASELSSYEATVSAAKELSDLDAISGGATVDGTGEPSLDIVRGASDVIEKRLDETLKQLKAGQAGEGQSGALAGVIGSSRKTIDTLAKLTSSSQIAGNAQKTSEAILRTSQKWVGPLIEALNPGEAKVAAKEGLQDTFRALASNGNVEKYSQELQRLIGTRSEQEIADILSTWFAKAHRMDSPHNVWSGPSGKGSLYPATSSSVIWLPRRSQN